MLVVKYFIDGEVTVSGIKSIRGDVSPLSGVGAGQGPNRHCYATGNSPGNISLLLG